MIRDLAHWRKTVKFTNQKEYWWEVRKLPVNDQPVAFALWSADQDAAVNAIIVAFHNYDTAIDGCEGVGYLPNLPGCDHYDNRE